jgi:hypothetical protein
MKCGAAAPKEAPNAFAAISSGPDGKPGTADDIHSRDPPPPGAEGTRLAREHLDLVGRAKRGRGWLMVKEFESAYAKWLADNEGDCPARIEDLVKYANHNQLVDPWGKPYLLKCGSSAPPTAPNGFCVISFGPDGKEGPTTTSTAGTRRRGERSLQSSVLDFRATGRGSVRQRSGR